MAAPYPYADRQFQADAFIRKELREAITRFPAFRSPHEGLAIIEEEFLEFRQEVFHGTRERQEAEAIQLAAMAIRFLIDISYQQEGR